MNTTRNSGSGYSYASNSHRSGRYGTNASDAAKVEVATAMDLLNDTNRAVKSTRIHDDHGWVSCIGIKYRMSQIRSNHWRWYTRGK
jgi:hypothetical protein